MSKREQSVWAVVLSVLFGVMVGTGIYVGLDTASAQDRPAPGGWDIRWGSGVYDGTATAIVKVRIEPDGTQTVEFVSLDKSQPVYVGGVTPGGDPTPEEPDDPKLQALGAAVRALPTPAENRKTIAKLYRDLAPLTAISTADQLKTVTNSMFRAVVNNTADPSGWSQWKDGVDSSIESSGVSSHAEHVQAWNLIADILD